jgi:hypothetical protein
MRVNTTSPTRRRLSRSFIGFMAEESQAVAGDATAATEVAWDWLPGITW